MTSVQPTPDSDILNPSISTLYTEFTALRTTYDAAFRTLWLSLTRNITFFRKYLEFKATKRFPTNLQIKRQDFNYSPSWDRLQLNDLIQQESRIILQAQSQLIQLRINAYYNIILHETLQLKERLQLSYITNNFQLLCPLLADNAEVYNEYYPEIRTKLLALFELPTLTEEEHLTQMYNSPTNDTTGERKRLRTADDEDKSRPSSFIPSFLTPSPIEPPLSSSSSSSSSSFIQPPSSLISPKHKTTHITNTKLKLITKHNLPKPSKNPTNTSNKTTIRITSITNPSSILASQSSHTNNIKIITDQLTSLTSAVASLLSNNNTIKNANVKHPNVKKKHNLPLITNTINTTTNKPSTTKRYNLNHTQQPPPLLHIAPTLYTQTPHALQPHHLTHIPHHFTPLSTHLNNHHHPYHYLSDQYNIHHSHDPPYAARNHPYPHPNHG